MNKLSVIPSLKIVSDDEAAKKLRELLKDADDGFRRVVRVGLYIEWINANLKHGQLYPWLEANCPEVTVRTILNWRSLAKNLLEWAKLKSESLSDLPIAGILLDAPLDKLPPNLRRAREKMEEALGESKSARQLFLFLGFKQGEIDPITGYPRKKIGRLKNSNGNPKDIRDAGTFANEQDRLEAMKLKADEVTGWLEENSDLKGFARLDENSGGKKALDRLAAAVAYAHRFLTDLKKSRES